MSVVMKGRLIRTRQMENYMATTLNFHLLQKALPLSLLEHSRSKVVYGCIKNAERDLPYFLGFPTAKFISMRERLNCLRYLVHGDINDLCS